VFPLLFYVLLLQHRKQNSAIIVFGIPKNIMNVSFRWTCTIESCFSLLLFLHPATLQQKYVFAIQCPMESYFHGEGYFWIFFLKKTTNSNAFFKLNYSELIKARVSLLIKALASLPHLFPLGSNIFFLLAISFFFKREKIKRKKLLFFQT